MTPARIVAVVLSWNDCDSVAALLASLAASTSPPDHVVIVDNGSDGGPPASVLRKFPAHELVALDRNYGYATAANAGIRRALDAGADWIWLLNTDIELPADALSILRAHAAGGPGDGNAGRTARVGMIGAKLVEPDGRVQALGGGRVSRRTGVARHETRDAARCDYLSGACLLVSARMLADIGLFDDHYFFYWEDIDLGFRARAAGWQLRVATECAVVHHESTTLGRWSRERWYHLFCGAMRFLEKRAPLPRAAVAFRLAYHTATMLGRGRYDAVRGAWLAVVSRNRSTRRDTVVHTHPAEVG